ncbi:nascent polypeptide-associated complex subunit alpha, muscle-specific form-like protein isoform X1 [Cinnamomum micranthum f. kanehirae]|uniref:Nascent polypeptide-associated complex subunit alpha, muscle-specific form-like protein isoform X1 n=1 Tax=Cinnamomum micranthum f. kanehirae TaxID=337451 RepID=A0A443NJT6_9MAGN|nr:nascent polypeptide-associated complex subunit alpha, muscle-specific form-like protein isoform X1 [Cinnamomum micranthum f. kanehirae]
MNRSFRAPESQMQASVQRRQGRNLGSVMKEKDEELALFLEMRKREKERNNLLLLHSSDDFDPPLGSKPGGSPIFKIVSSTPRKTATDDFLNSDSDKNDYDWLLTPPGTPLFPSLELESNKPTIGQIGTPKARPTALKSRLANPQMEPTSRGSLASRQSTLSSGLNSNAGVRRPSSSGGLGSTASRPATPTGRPTLSSTSKPSRPSTPTSRTTIPSSRPAAVPSVRSSTPAARSSTPTARPSITATKPASRSATPTRRPSTPSSVPSNSAPPGRSSSVTKSAPAVVSRNPAPPRASSPSVKSRPWQPSEMPGFSLDVPPNLRTSMPERPVSASRGRPGAPSARSSSVDAGSNGRVRRQSCSPSRGRAPNGSIHTSGSSVPVGSRSHSNGGDSVSPVLIGTKMVERVINMRRLAPPRQDDQRSANGNLAGKPLSSPDSTGFGRNLSKKSLDMALRHMDIRRSNPGSLRPLMANIPASSMYSVRSGPAKSRTVSVSDSPLATSSNASSEQSVNNNILCLDGIEIEDDDIGSERGRCSPASHRVR